mgnify:FL=1
MKRSLFTTPQEAEAAFYEAFARQDIDAMMNVWADDDDIWCVHPQGPRLSGVEAVRESWRAIFRSGQQLRFQLHDSRMVQGMMVSVHSVYEQVQSAIQPEAVGTMIATNVYVKTGEGWRMLVHHASPAPAPEQPTRRRTSAVLH